MTPRHPRPIIGRDTHAVAKSRERLRQLRDGPPHRRPSYFRLALEFAFIVIVIAALTIALWSIGVH